MRSSRILGVLTCLAGLAVNKWTLEAFIVGDGVIETTKVMAVTVAAELVLIGAGAWLAITAPRLRRPSGGQLTLLAVSIALSIALAEVALRFTSDSIDAFAASRPRLVPQPLFQADETGWRMLPNREFAMVVEQHTNTYASNAQGFRSPHDYAQPASTRVALAGDSFTWGLGVDYAQTFGALLEQRLAGGQVNNFGMPGFGIDQMWQSVRTQVLPLRPALVVVGFIDDDFARSLYPARIEEGMAKPTFQVSGGQVRAQPGGRTSWLLRHSAVWRLLDRAFLTVRPYGDWWELNTALFEAIAADCARQGVPVVFVRLPQIERRAFPSLARYFAVRGLAYIDIGQSAPEETIHYKEDRHLNASGHARVASVLADWIAKHHPQLMK